MKQAIAYFVITVALINAATAQPSSPIQPGNQNRFLLGWVDTLQSVELHEKRTLNIYLPDGYSKDSAKSYPVIYLLDGSANEDFIHVTGIVQFLTMIEVMPKSIVVGIANVDRRRDFTFPTGIEQDKKDFPTTGGSAAFMLFVEKELQPFINKKYKTNNRTTLIGQSLGGLFAVEVYLKKPTLFTNYIIVSPSLWWNNESLLADAAELLKSQSKDSHHLCLSVGNEEKVMVADAKRFTELLATTKQMRRLIIYPCRMKTT